MSELMAAALKAEEMFELDELEGYAFVECPACNSVNNRIDSGLRMLGTTTYHRCWYCGTDFEED